MGYQHSIFIVFSGLSYLLLLLDTTSHVTALAQITRISLMIMGVLILCSLLLQGKPHMQQRSLRIIQSIIIVSSGGYYYFLWASGIVSQWFGADGHMWSLMISGILPIFGYGFLSTSVRILNRNLKLLRNVDRLRG